MSGHLVSDKVSKSEISCSQGNMIVAAQQKAGNQTVLW